MGIHLYRRTVKALFLLFPAGQVTAPAPAAAYAYYQHQEKHQPRREFHRGFGRRCFGFQHHHHHHHHHKLQQQPRTRTRSFEMSSSSPSPISSNKPQRPLTLSAASTSVSSFTSYESSATASSSRSAFSESHHDYTLTSLQDYAKKLIDANLSNGDKSTRASVSIVVAGGGGHSISTLASTSGASSLLLEGVVAYDRNSYLKYCGMSDRKGFVFTSHEAAKVASEAALKHALTIRSMDDDVRSMPRCIGIGSASALVSGSSSSSSSTSSGVKGYGHVVATRSDGLQLSLDVTLKGVLDDGTEGRSRVDEDIFMSHLILRSVEHLERNSPQFIDNILDAGKDDTPTATTTITTTAGDTIIESWSNIPQPIDSAAVIEEAARRVVEGGEEAVVLLPLYEASSSDGDDASAAPSIPVSFRALCVPVLPNQCLVFPGSFNPPHKGHIALANASIRTLERLRPYVHRRHNEKPLFFELSLMNADKPAIDPTTVADRVQKFLQLAHDETNEDSDGTTTMPQQWGIVLTRAPLFAQKLSSLQDCIMDRATTAPNVNFVIGTDTLVRILNPKYYNNDRDNMVSSLLAMKGSHYVVGGRLEQNKDSSCEEPPKFVSGEDELKGLPEELVSMFTVMTESEFRVDISSSEIRAGDNNCPSK